MKETPRRRITVKSSSNETTTAGKRVGVRGELFSARPQPFLITGDFFLLFMYVIQHGFILSPLRFHCVGGCLNRTQDCCNSGIGSQML